MKVELESNDVDIGKHSVIPIPFKAHKVNWLSAELL